MSKPTVAIIGGPDGFLGKPTLAAIESETFADKFQFPIKVLSRSKRESTSKTEYIEVTWDESNVASIAKAIDGVDVVIELIGVFPETLGLIEKVLEKAKPKLFIPSQFGTELDKLSYLSQVPPFFDIKDKHAEKVRSLGIKTVSIITGAFTLPGFFLYEIVGGIGIDSEKKAVTYLGDPSSRLSVTNVNDIGKVIASVASINPRDLPDKVRVQSDEISYKDVVERYEKTHNIKLKNNGVISKEESLQNLNKIIDNGFKQSDFFLLINTIISQGVDKGLLFSSNEDELVNPGENLWKWTKY
ncbi:uncharacterized protein PRCAT00004109001 [Priceomyces carsonii]|uniref:uncharacterized protein n=1 Tax=Priceomyces carsonii TaxID=28549 RepID=UPI002EDB7DFB|nr:unnamed protein product [Priceomyces carsonii]